MTITGINGVNNTQGTSRTSGSTAPAEDTTGLFGTEETSEAEEAKKSEERALLEAQLAQLQAELDELIAKKAEKMSYNKELESQEMLLDIVTWPMDSVMPYDPFNPKARDIYWKYLKHLYDLGIDAWWTDGTEPDHFRIKRSDYDLQTYLGSFRKVRNAYALQSNKGVYEHQRATTSDKRVFAMTRSGFIGQQRYATASWSGDIDVSWEAFKKQIPAGLHRPFYCFCQFRFKRSIDFLQV